MKKLKQADLFADVQPIKKEDTDMMNESQKEASALINSVHEHSKILKYGPFGILHPDRLKDQDANKTIQALESFKPNTEN